jgi:NAD+ kinase
VSVNRSEEKDPELRPDVGIVYSPWVPGAEELANTLARRVNGVARAWVLSLTDLEAQRQPEIARLLVTVGGDGTILRAVAATVRSNVPLVGVNMGRVGFMTELSATEAPERIESYARGEGWIEERTMLEALVLPKGSGAAVEGQSPILGLNDAVVGRKGVARMVHVEVCVDGQPLATYSCDAVIVATGTGSTGYALSSGGPILYAESPSLLIKPVSPQFSLDAALVLHPDSVVELTPRTNDEAVLSMDGHVDVSLAPGDAVRVQRSALTARFLRSGPHPRLPEALARRLGSPPRVE